MWEAVKQKVGVCREGSDCEGFQRGEPLAKGRCGVDSCEVLSWQPRAADRWQRSFRRTSRSPASRGVRDASAGGVCCACVNHSNTDLGTSRASLQSARRSTRVHEGAQRCAKERPPWCKVVRGGVQTCAEAHTQGRRALRPRRCRRIRAAQCATGTQTVPRSEPVRRCAATCSNVQQRTATYSNVQQRTVPYSNVQQRTATYSDVQQRTATYSNVQQRTATYSNVQQRTATYSNLQQRTATYSNVQQRTATYSTVQYRTVPYSTVQYRTVPYSTVQ